jgi:N6-adenosine-specific RNA methylase IME4
VRYRTIVADPPWEYDDGFGTTSHNAKTGRRWNAKRTPLPYPSMTVEQIAALPVAEWADSDAFLFLWTTNRYLPQAFRIVDSWGFRYRQTIVWRKTGDGGGSLPAAVAPVHNEFLLVAKVGSPKRGECLPSSVIDAPRGRRHSTKPELFLDLIERVSPAPRVELFARRQRLGWDTYGNEALEHIKIEAAGG